MLPEEWPIRSTPERGTGHAFGGAGNRLSTARRDFFLPASYRLTEQERALITAMLHRLVEDVAAEIQAQLQQEWLPANEDLSGLIDRLAQSGLLDITALMSLLLRRADEERISGAFNARPAGRAASIIQPLVSSEEADIAAAAMAVLIARGRRRNRYSQPTIELDDLPREAASRLAYAIAAGLCERKPVNVTFSAAERALCSAAADVLERHDPTKSVDRLTAELVRLLDERGQLDESWIRLAIDNAEMTVLSHVLARRAAVGAMNAADELMSGDARRIMMLLRLAEVPRPLAGHLLAVLGDLLGMAADLHALALFDSLAEDRLEVARSWLVLAPDLKSSLKALGHGHGAL